MAQTDQRKQKQLNIILVLIFKTLFHAKEIRLKKIHAVFLLLKFLYSQDLLKKKNVLAVLRPIKHPRFS